MIHCEKCNTPIARNHINTRAFAPCTSCKTALRTDIFAAATQHATAGQSQQTLVVSDDAGCYYHPSKKAVVPCDCCGRFLCPLCDVENQGEHICFSCLESGQQTTAVQTLETHRFLPDSLAIRLSLIPPLSVVFWFFTCITAPLSIFYALRYWKSESSITPRRKKWRLIVTLICSSAQIAGWAGFIFMLRRG